MVLYLDLVFLLNSGVDALALYITAMLAGLPVRWRRLLTAAALGGTYGVICLLPACSAAGGMLGKLAAAMGLIYFSFGAGRDFLRRVVLFLMLSCTMGGVMLAAAQIFQSQDQIEYLIHLNWKVFFLVTGGCYFFLSVVFRGGARHAVARQLSRGWLERDGRRVELMALLDTGHTLTDPVRGLPVLIVEQKILDGLWTEEEKAVLRDLEVLGAACCLEQLNAVSPGRFRLLPYRAVGVSAGLLLSFQADAVVLDRRPCGKPLVAISPTCLSETGEYSALWGGMNDKREEYRAA